jgi:hypothetical protein
MTKHTSTPWEVGTMSKDGRVNVAAFAYTNKVRSVAYASGLSDGEAEANAEFIVRAVNAYDALVSALKATRVSLIDDEHYQEFKPLLRTIDEAIAKAEGK